MFDCRSDGEKVADEAIQAAVMVCDTCGAPTPPGRYWFHSNAAGENLGGIFCSKGCVEIGLQDLRSRMKEAHDLLDRGDAYGKDATNAMLLLGDTKCVHGVHIMRPCAACGKQEADR